MNENSYIKGEMELSNSTVYGGNSVKQREHDFSVHIYLEENAEHWSDNLTLFCPVDDFDIPDDSDLFYFAVCLARKALEEGHDVFVGCLGGQGRTGMFMACLYGLIYKEDSPPVCIERVRDIYNPRAVETEEQAEFVYDFLDYWRPREEREATPPMSWSSIWKMVKTLITGKA